MQPQLQLQTSHTGFQYCATDSITASAMGPANKPCQNTRSVPRTKAEITQNPRFCGAD